MPKAKIQANLTERKKAQLKNNLQRNATRPSHLMHYSDELNVDVPAAKHDHI